MAIGDSLLTTSELVSFALALQSEERQLAIRQITGDPAMRGTRSGRARRAPDSIATVIGMRVIESLYAIQPLSFVPPGTEQRGVLSLPPPVDSVPRYLSMDSLPDVVRQRAVSLANTPVAIGWVLPAGTTGLTSHIGPVRGDGPFYSIDITHTTLYARGGSRSGGYASGTTLWFVYGPQGWVVFWASSWVTQVAPETGDRTSTTSQPSAKRCERGALHVSQRHRFRQRSQCTKHALFVDEL